MYPPKPKILRKSLFRKQMENPAKADVNTKPKDLDAPSAKQKCQTRPAGKSRFSTQPTSWPG